MRLTVDDCATYAYTGSRALRADQPTLVFIHGAANDHSVWALQSRYFAHHGRNVLAFDLPAHGRSAGACLATVEAIADWTMRALDAADMANATIIGHSLGALATLACAARHPDRVERAVLIGPAVPMQVSDELLRAADLDPQLAYELICGWSHSAQGMLGGNPVPGMWMTGSALRLMERSQPGTLHADLLACRNYAGGLDAAAATTCPVLVVMGARDIMTPPKAAQEMLSRLPDQRAIVLPDAGHAMMAEQPDAVLDALRSFLQR
jgi:pimeloyl-ACP methyl ester carboxylesterase